jgi:hypothetical protein
MVGVPCLVVAAVLAASAGRLIWWQPYPVVGGAPGDGYQRRSGIVHVHTTLSDGGGSPEEVIAAAQKAGLDFLGITDHNHLEGKGLEGYHGNLLVLVGAELSTTAGHLLALGLARPEFRFSGDVDDGLADVRDLGGVSFAAHPLSPRAEFRWTGWDLPGPWGVELLNGDSEWRSAGPWLLRTGVEYLLNRRYALLRTLGSPDATLARWDGLLAKRDAAGLFGADAHSRIPLGKGGAGKGRALRFPSYDALFAVARTHVLLDRPLTREAPVDARTIVAALSSGRSYLALDGLAAADEVAFTLEADGRRWSMGDQAPVPDTSSGRLRVFGRMPAQAQIRLLRDGHPFQEGPGPLDVGLPGAGVYRAEIRLPGWATPWVLTNPIYVFDHLTREARASAAAWPVPPPPPPSSRLIDDFASGSFAAEFDPSSWMETPPFEAAGAPHGTRVAKMRFRLGAPGPGRPYTWCALVSRQSRDLSGGQGLLFRVRSDQVRRVSVQVRDENPKSTDGGTEWWSASVRASPSWQTVCLPFRRFHSQNPNSDGRLDLDQVRQIVFLIDQGTAAPGTSGTIWLGDLRLY